MNYLIKKHDDAKIGDKKYTNFTIASSTVSFPQYKCDMPYQTSTCSKSTIETLELGVKYIRS